MSGGYFAVCELGAMRPLGKGAAPSLTVEPGRCLSLTTTTSSPPNCPRGPTAARFEHIHMRAGGGFAGRPSPWQEEPGASPGRRRIFYTFLQFILHFFGEKKKYRLHFRPSAAKEKTIWAEYAINASSAQRLRRS